MSLKLCDTPKLTNLILTHFHCTIINYPPQMFQINVVQYNFVITIVLYNELCLYMNVCFPVHSPKKTVRPSVYAHDNLRTTEPMLKNFILHNLQKMIKQLEFLFGWD